MAKKKTSVLLPGSISDLVKGTHHLENSPAAASRIKIVVTSSLMSSVRIR